MRVQAGGGVPPPAAEDEHAGSLQLYGALRRVCTCGGEVQLLAGPAVRPLQRRVAAPTAASLRAQAKAQLRRWAELLGPRCSFLAARSPPAPMSPWFALRAEAAWLGAVRFGEGAVVEGLRLVGPDAPIAASPTDPLDVLAVCPLGDVLPLGWASRRPGRAPHADAARSPTTPARVSAHGLDGTGAAKLLDGMLSAPAVAVVLRVPEGPPLLLTAAAVSDSDLWPL